MIAVRVQLEPFDLADETLRITAGRTDIGGVATFTGYVRGDDALDALTLEHYPTMTEKALRGIADKAAARWPVLAGTVIHRHGRLVPGDAIVMVVIAAAHRGPAFAACEFLMDYLKTKAPFWKKEEVAGSARWVEAREADDCAVRRWENEGGAE